MALIKMPQTDKIIRGYWYGSNNFGDNINYLILNNLSGGKQVVHCTERDLPHYIVCGSILSEAKKQSIVWGAGFGWGDHNSNNFPKKTKVIGVRGDLTAEKCGRDVSAIGDPALLLPIISPRQKKVTKEIGIIPHWSNVEDTVNRFPNHFVINPMASPEIFIDNIVSCNKIFSESLHGLIVADAYGVENAWIDLGGETGDGFKYRDYYSTTNSPETKAIKEIDETACVIHPYKYNIETLLNSCPFYEPY